MITYGYVHNPYEGHSPATVRRLLERLGECALEWPPLEAAGSAPQKNDDDAAQLPLL
jgi:hypothetical protein